MQTGLNAPCLRWFMEATHQPQQYGVQLSDVEMPQLLMAGASPRGMSYLIAPQNPRQTGTPGSCIARKICKRFPVCMTHRLFLNPMYAYRKEQLLPDLIKGILNQLPLVICALLLVGKAG
jgi:MoxR-like ATPase